MLSSLHSLSSLLLLLLLQLLLLRAVLVLAPAAWVRLVRDLVRPSWLSNQTACHSDALPVIVVKSIWNRKHLFSVVPSTQ
jgi:hypothetical protein